MNRYFLCDPIHKELYELTPELAIEFDRLYIQSLAFKYRRDRWKFGWRIRLGKFGSWLISWGHDIQRMAHLPFAVTHTSWKVIAIQSIKIRHHR